MSPAHPVEPDIVSRINGWSEIDINEARIMTIWALGSSGDASVVARLVPLFDSTDAGVRKIVVYALGALPGGGAVADARARPERRCRRRAVERRRGSGAARQRRGRPGAAGRCSTAHSSSRPSSATCGKYEDQGSAADVMISGLRAAAALNDPALKASVEGLSQQDRSLRTHSRGARSAQDDGVGAL